MSEVKWQTWGAHEYAQVVSPQLGPVMLVVSPVPLHTAPISACWAWVSPGMSASGRNGGPWPLGRARALCERSMLNAQEQEGGAALPPPGKLRVVCRCGWVGEAADTVRVGPGRYACPACNDAL